MEYLIVGYGFLGIGPVFVIAAILVWGIQRRRRRKATRLVSATVTELARVRREGRTAYSPVYEYYADGVVQRVRSSVYSSKCPFQVGDVVEIHFDPSKPTRIYVEKDEKLVWFIIFIFLAVGIVFSVIGAGMLLVAYPA